MQKETRPYPNAGWDCVFYIKKSNCCKKVIRLSCVRIGLYFFCRSDKLPVVHQRGVEHDEDRADVVDNRARNRREQSERREQDRNSVDRHRKRAVRQAEFLR